MPKTVLTPPRIAALLAGAALAALPAGASAADVVGSGFATDATAWRGCEAAASCTLALDRQGFFPTQLPLGSVVTKVRVALLPNARVRPRLLRREEDDRFTADRRRPRSRRQRRRRRAGASGSLRRRLEHGDGRPRRRLRRRRRGARPRRRALLRRLRAGARRRRDAAPRRAPSRATCCWRRSPRPTGTRTDSATRARTLRPLRPEPAGRPGADEPDADPRPDAHAGLRLRGRRRRRLVEPGGDPPDDRQARAAASCGRRPAGLHRGLRRQRRQGRPERHDPGQARQAAARHGRDRPRLGLRLLVGPLQTAEGRAGEAAEARHVEGDGDRADREARTADARPSPSR